MPIYKTEGIVLRTRELGDADRIVVLLTKDYGRISAVAKGARKIKSKLAGKVQPLNYVRLLLYEGKNLDVISQVEVLEAFLNLRMHLQKLGFAFSLSEIFEGMVEEGQRNTAAFYLLLTGLHVLACCDDAEIATRAIELKLLSVMGYQPRLDFCTECGRAFHEGEVVWFSPAHGGITCEDCCLVGKGEVPIKLGTLLTMRQLLEGDLRKLERLRVSAETRRELENSIHAFLLYHLDKKIKTWDFLQNVKDLEKRV